jgi:hypothetical protein
MASCAGRREVLSGFGVESKKQDDFSGKTPTSPATRRILLQRANSSCRAGFTPAKAGGLGQNSN